MNVWQDFGQKIDLAVRYGHVTSNSSECVCIKDTLQGTSSITTDLIAGSRMSCLTIPKGHLYSRRLSR